MDNSSKIISNNIIELRDSLGLSQKSFALLSKISRPTLVNIESGKKSFKVKSLDGIVNFTKIPLEKLSRQDFKPSEKLRDEILQIYKNNPEIYVILNDTPSIPYCIKYKILKTDFLDIARERREIIKFIFDSYGWKINGNSLTNTLKRMPDLIEIRPHESKRNTNVYLRREI